MASSDPYYNRKPVPAAFTEAVGGTGLTSHEEYLSRERKLSSAKGDLRKFSNPKGEKGTLDPHYARKPVPDSMIRGVGETGLTPEEEYLNREKKMMVNGVDIRRFSTSSNGGMAPQSDPYYGRKSVAEPQIHGVGDSGMSRAEEFETRENKASLFDLSKDPFEQLTGSGHRGSVAAVASEGAADARRRSSAAAPDAARAASNVHGHGSHSGYAAGSSLPPIDSGRETFSESTGSAANNQFNYGPTTTTTTTTTTGTTGSHIGSSGTHGISHAGAGTHEIGSTGTHGIGHSGTHEIGSTGTHGVGHTGTTGTTGTTGSTGLYHDMTTVNDPDSVAPDERR